MANWATPPPATGVRDVDEPGVAPANLTITYVSAHDIAVDFGKPWLADEADVDQYLKKLKVSLLKAVNAGKRIRT